MHGADALSPTDPLRTGSTGNTGRVPTRVIELEAATGPSSPKRRPFRRDQILDVAIELFYERGYHATGMDDIGAAANITGPAIYRHFANKEAILDAALKQGVSEIVDKVDEIVGRGMTPKRTLRALVQNYIRAILNRPALAVLVLNERRLFSSATRAWFDRADRLHMEEWVHALSLARPELTEADVRVMIGAAVGLLDSVLVYRSGLDQRHIEDLLTEMAMAAMLEDDRRAPGAGRRPKARRR